MILRYDLLIIGPRGGIEVNDASLALAIERGEALDTTSRDACLLQLGSGRVGTCGRVTAVRARNAELEQMLLEFGFVEGARVEILHQAPFGGDPIAVRVDDLRVALRRREADAVLIRTATDRGKDLG